MLNVSNTEKAGSNRGVGGDAVRNYIFRSVVKEKYYHPRAWIASSP
jgi:hypothetical protein